MLPRTILRTRVVRPSTTLLRRGYATPGSTSEPTPSSGSSGKGKTLAACFGFGFCTSLGFVLAEQWRHTSPPTVQCESPSSPTTANRTKPSTHLASPTDDPLIFDRTIKDTEAETFTRQASKAISGVVDGVKQKIGQVGRDAVNAQERYQPGRPKEYDDPQNPMRIRMSTWVMALQDHIVQGLEQLESSVPPNTYNSSPTAPTFHRDHWLRPQGGEGSSCVLANGRVFEKAGVNVSVVHGTLPPAAIRQMKADHKSLVTREEDKEKSLPFFAAGISIVLHPWNPHAPTVHLNYRYFEVDPPSTPQSALDTTTPGATTTDKEPLAWWFGGGSDLTPSYLYPEDAEHFHNTLKSSADAHHRAYYPVWKKWCDKYFYIPHRGESRGIGGIFFDDLTSTSEIHAVSAEGEGVVEQGKSILRQGVQAGGDELEKLRSKIESILPSAAQPSIGAQSTGTVDTTESENPSADDIFRLVQTMSSSFLDSYVPIMHRRINMPYTEEERRWQLLRRGRYVEFNLVHDRGTKFGLFTPGARIESILMSLPQTARWEYMSDMGAAGSGTREEELMKVLKSPVEWASV
ncbi:hypothetical protein QFC22_003382 [Naganishia vaughanmartiniae]|uniref:Uncharacterized protein n=1 Tax=Naganishia vaughanmartiniae TaxID=1424756 RepID=A0ACC2XA58_9TREE|nr:hypothetical protein QFC22_003382 [Naganishia vaughanmartiniae]